MTEQTTHLTRRSASPWQSMLAFMLVAVLLSACGGGSVAGNLNDDNGNTATSNPIVLAGGLYPSLPSDNNGEVTRGASAIETIPGSNALMASNGVAVDTALVLTSTTNELAWGLYRIEGLAGRKVDSLTISAVPGDLGQSYNVGVSNFSDGVWEFLETATLPEYEYDLIGEQARLVSRLGNLYFIVVVYGGNSVTIEQAAINSELDANGNLSLAPAMGSRPQVSEGLSDRIVVTWSAIDGADSYELWRALDTDGIEEQFSLLTATTETTCTDTDIQLSTEYSYKIRGVNEAGYGRFSEDSSGWAGTTPPPGEDEDSNGTRLETFGAIEAIDATSITVDNTVFSIDANTQWQDDNDLPVNPEYFSVGMLAEVHGKSDGTSGWIAVRVEEEDLHHGQENEHKGSIDSISESVIVVDNITYIITSDTRWLDDNDNPLTQVDFKVGDYIEIEARLTVNGDWITLQVQKEDEGGGGGDEMIDEDGPIQEITATTITVNDRLFIHDEHTEWEDGDNNTLTWSEFEAGDLVKVDGINDGGGGWHATRVRLDN